MIPKAPKEPERLDYEQLVDKFEALFETDFINLDKEAIRTPKIYFEVQRELQRQALSLEYWTQTYAELTQRRRLHYSGRLPASHYAEDKLLYPPQNQTEANEMMKADKMLQECSKYLSEAERRVKFCEETLSMVKSRHWDIQNAINYRKMMEGRT